MKIAVIVVAALACAANGSKVGTVQLRGRASESFSDSTCINYKDEATCNKSQDDEGVDCVWCKCDAIPSECLSVKQSAQVPPSVFDCDSRKANTLLKSAKGFTYTLKDEEVDGDLCDPASKSYSGYMDISGSKFDSEGENKHLFFWFFEKRGISKTDESIPMIVWLTGGPGCSSTLALLTENGPCSVVPDGTKTQVNPYSWTETAHVLWLDQPSGVGYSYGKATDKNEDMVGEDAYYFLQAFFKSHPEYLSNPLYIVGESYGGHYAPAIAHKIFTENKHVKNDMPVLNLVGVAVGNGLTKPEEQYKWYPEMAYNNCHGLKLVNEQTYEAMKAAVSECTSLIHQCNKGNNFIDSFACQSAFVVCNLAETSPYQMTGLNPYDITKQCGDHPLCYDFENVETFLNLESTMAALHVDSSKVKHWQSCNMGINMKFRTDWMKDFSPYIADMLNSGEISILIYAGDLDYICNYLGNRAWTLGLEWDHSQEFNDADDHEWGEDEDGKATGLARSANNFTYLQVYNAGHMVPSDQPAVALEMIRTFVEKQPF